MQEDPQNTVTTNPDWVSYFIQDPKTRQWVHTTLFKVPAGATVNVTVLGYDGCTPLRNPFWGKVTGTIGGAAYVDGKTVTALDSWPSCSVGHTFSIPGIGLNVPMGSPTTWPRTTPVRLISPCTSGPKADDEVQLRTPRRRRHLLLAVPGSLRRRLRDGFGGPMQTIGFMTGNMEVAS